MINNRFILTAGGALLLPLVIIFAPWYPAQLSAGLLLIAFLPGYATLLACWPQQPVDVLSHLESWLIAGPISYSLTIILLLFLVLAHVPLQREIVALGLGGITLGLTLIAWWRSKVELFLPPPHSTTITTFQWRFAFSILFILLLAAGFRLTNLHYSDYQGDEADILLRAVALTYGQSEVIFTHSKGPGEILLLNAIYALTNRFDEFTARLLFAIAGTMSAGLLAWLGSRLFHPGVGLLAGVLVAIDGVFVSYARTAQYQSVVLLLILAVVLCLGYFYEFGGSVWGWHILGMFLLAACFLFHFETLFLIPLVTYLTLGSDQRLELSAVVGRILRLWPSLLLCVLLVAFFYVPFVLNPNVKSTSVYLENRISGGELPPFNNLAHFFYYEALKYNSAYFVGVFDLLLLAVGVVSWLKLPRMTRLLVLTAVGGGLGLTWLNQSYGAALAITLGLALFLAGVILSPHTPFSQRVLWLWLGPAFWVYVFWVSRPGKHHYLFLGALTLLITWLIFELGSRWPILSSSVGRRLTVGFGMALLMLFAGHTSMLFLGSNWEYILTYPEHKSIFYPTDSQFPYGSRIGFGYPFRLGWQLVGQLRRTGQLAGDWAGNDDGNAPRWYMLGQPPTPCYPRYVLQGEITYKGDDEFGVPFDPVSSGYRPRYRLWGNNRLRLTILEFSPINYQEVIDLTEPFRFEPPATAIDFAIAMTQPVELQPHTRLEPALVLGEGSELKSNAPPAYVERAKQLEGRVTLAGYDGADVPVRPGEFVPLTLYWHSQNLLSLRYKVFVHVLSADGQLVAQADGFPVCGLAHANTWEPGSLILDRHLLYLTPDMLPGNYTLWVGMYEPELNLRLNYFDKAGNEQGNSVKVGDLTVVNKE
jgi:4-amino-4-deoxy-L-arabinose transferase-like glycosyltransferase